MKRDFSTCDLGLDADTIMRALRDELDEPDAVMVKAHAERCPSCSSHARALTWMRDGWQRSLALRPVGRRAHRSRSRPRIVALTLAFATAAAITLLVWPREPDAGVDDRRSALLRTMSAPAAMKTLAMAQEDPSRGGVTSSAPTVSVPTTISVEPKTTFHLSFAIDASAFADLDGPADATARADGLDLRSGITRITAAEKPIVVDAPHVHAVGTRAKWTVEVDGGKTRVTVLEGAVGVREEGGAITRLEQGEELTLPRPQVVVDLGALLAEANAKLRSNDRAGAATKLEAFLAAAPENDPRRGNATFHLAEIELATGKRAIARARLEALAKGTDARLAEDATTLLDRAKP